MTSKERIEKLVAKAEQAMAKPMVTPNGEYPRTAVSVILSLADLKAMRIVLRAVKP